MGASGQGGAPPRPASPLRLVFAADTSPRALLAALPAFEKDVAALDAALLAAATRLESGVAAARKQLAEEAAKAEELIKTCVAAEQQRTAPRCQWRGRARRTPDLTPHSPALPCPAFPYSRRVSRAARAAAGPRCSARTSRRERRRSRTPGTRRTRSEAGRPASERCARARARELARAPLRPPRTPEPRAHSIARVRACACSRAPAHS